MTGNLTSQAAVMELNHVPNDIINNINPISLIVRFAPRHDTFGHSLLESVAYQKSLLFSLAQIFIPIFDLFIYPFFRKHGIRFTPIRRITAGFACAALAMIWATITQLYIYRKSPCGYSANTCATEDGIVSALRLGDNERSSLLTVPDRFIFRPSLPPSTSGRRSVPTL